MPRHTQPGQGRQIKRIRPAQPPDGVQYDVIILGAGPQGVAAAVAAGERGARVLVIEPQYDEGGAWCAALHQSYTHPGRAALMQDIHRLATPAWGEMLLDGMRLQALLRQRLAYARAEQLFGATPIQARRKEDRLRWLRLAAIGERHKLRAHVFIDATPDYTLLRLCGGAFAHRDIRVDYAAQIGGIHTRVNGVFDPVALEEYKNAFAREHAAGLVGRHARLPQVQPMLRGGYALVCASAQGITANSAQARARAQLICRDNAVDAVAFLQRNMPGYEDCFLLRHAQAPRLLGEPAPKSAGPAIPFEPYDGYTLALGSLCAKGLENVLFIPPCASELAVLCAAGQAAGTYAALSLAYDGERSRLEQDTLRRALLAEDLAPHAPL